MYVVNNAEREHVTEFPGIDHVTLASQTDGLKSLSLWRQSLSSGAATPYHRHPCDEVVVVTGGSGELRIGEKVHPFGPDSTLIIPAGMEHQIVNTGGGDLEVIVAFAQTPVQIYFPNGEPIPLVWTS